RPAPGARERAGSALRRASGEPGHPCGDGDADRWPLRRRRVDDREHRPDRPRLRADRRAAARVGRPDRTRRRLTSDTHSEMATGDATGQTRLRVRAAVDGSVRPNVSTGVSVLDHLVSLLAEYGAFELSLEVEPGSAAAEIAAAGRALGEALWDPVRAVG